MYNDSVCAVAGLEGPVAKTPPHFGTAGNSNRIATFRGVARCRVVSRKEATRAPSLRLDIDRDHRGDSRSFRLDAGVSSRILDLALASGQGTFDVTETWSCTIYSLKNVAVTIGVDEPMTLMLTTSDPKKRQWSRPEGRSSEAEPSVTSPGIVAVPEP